MITKTIFPPRFSNHGIMEFTMKKSNPFPPFGYLPIEILDEKK